MAERIRKGMWTLYGGQIGIVVEIGLKRPAEATSAALDWVEFHQVLDDGTTGEITIVPAEEVAQAPYGLIPEARRPSREAAMQFGYL